MTTDAEVEVEHGVSDGHYSNLPGPYQSAVLICLCGFEAISWSRLSNGGNWEEAGALMDAHLEEQPQG